MKILLKKYVVYLLLICVMLFPVGCAKEQPVTTAVFEYEPFSIQLEQTVNQDDEIQVNVKLVLPEGTTWGDIVSDPVHDDENSMVILRTNAYNLFQSPLTEEDIAGKLYDEIIEDTDFMEQYNGIREYPGYQTSGVSFDADFAQSTFTFSKDEVDTENTVLCLVLPHYEIIYHDNSNSDSIVLKQFEGPFILNWEAVY